MIQLTYIAESDCLMLVAKKLAENRPIRSDADTAFACCAVTAMEMLCLLLPSGTARIYRDAGTVRIETERCTLDNVLAFNLVWSYLQGLAERTGARAPMESMGKLVERRPMAHDLYLPL